MFAAGDVLRFLLGRRRRSKIQILSDFNGLVRHGELLLVLGRPGSGCSTMLKVLAGDVHGLYVEAGSEVNYQGK